MKRDESGSAAPRLRPRLSVAWLLLIVLVVVASALRLFSVAKVPPGFYIDEAAISAQVICLRQSGATLAGEHLPLFTQVLGGGYLTPAYLAPALIWTGIFGDSISSFRMLTAVFSLLFIFGSYVLGFRFWQTREAAWLSALSAAISPWVFQFARVAWDPSLAPVYLVWALAFLWSESRYRNLEAVLSGVFFSLAAYCYPPLRVQIAIVLPFAIAGLIWREEKLARETAVIKTRVSRAIMTFAAFLILSLPLAIETLTGKIQGRFQMLSVFNASYLEGHYGHSSFFTGLQALLENFGLLLSPSYLLVNGDSNLRHSTGFLGIWSWLDGLGVLVAIVAGWLILVRRSEVKARWFEVSFVLIGYLAGILPAAMTWESNPHALRSFGAVVFLVLGVGGSLSLMWRHSNRARSAILGMAFAAFLFFVNVYFVKYPPRAKIWFDNGVVEIAAQLESENRLGELADELAKRGIEYDPMAVSYYRLAARQMTCPISSAAQ